MSSSSSCLSSSDSPARFVIATSSMRRSRPARLANCPCRTRSRSASYWRTLLADVDPPRFDRAMASPLARRFRPRGEGNHRRRGRLSSPGSPSVGWRPQDSRGRCPDPVATREPVGTHRDHHGSRLPRELGASVGNTRRLLLGSPSVGSGGLAVARQGQPSGSTAVRTPAQAEHPRVLAGNCGTAPPSLCSRAAASFRRA
jgi:hypothetical protein